MDESMIDSGVSFADRVAERIAKEGPEGFERAKEEVQNTHRMIQSHLNETIKMMIDNRDWDLAIETIMVAKKCF